MTPLLNSGGSRKCRRRRAGSKLKKLLTSIENAHARISACVLYEFPAAGTAHYLLWPARHCLPCERVIFVVLLSPFHIIHYWFDRYIFSFQRYISRNEIVS